MNITMNAKTISSFFAAKSPLGALYVLMEIVSYIFDPQTVVAWQREVICEDSPLVLLTRVLAQVDKPPLMACFAAEENAFMCQEGIFYECLVQEIMKIVIGSRGLQQRYQIKTRQNMEMHFGG